MARTTDRTPTIDDFKDVMNWQTSGWSHDVAQLLFTVALQNKLPIYPGDVPRNTILRISKEGPAALALQDVTRMKLDVPLGAQLDDASVTEIGEAHCGAMPKEAFNGHGLRATVPRRPHGRHVAEGVREARLRYPDRRQRPCPQRPGRAVVHPATRAR
jgi:hypothetical protein